MNEANVKRVLGSNLVVLALLIGLLPFLDTGAATAQSTCAPVALVPLRGSGEKRIDKTMFYGSQITNGYEGETLTKLLAAFYAENPSLANTPIVEVDERYPATAVDKSDEALAPNLISSPVYSSSQIGSAATIGAMSRFRKGGGGCASTKFVLVGYSQGAMVARDAALTVPSMIAGVYMVGDPWQRPNSVGVTGTGRGGVGVFRAHFPDEAPKLDKFYSASYPSHSYCHTKDPVCDIYGSLPSANDGPHKNYFVGGEASSEAAVLAQLVSGTPTTPPVRSSALNVAFVVDTTGSMSPYIADARRNITTISQNVLRTSPSSQFSLVEYKDYGDPFVARTVVPLTGDAGALDDGINTLGADGGGDYPESVFSGIVEGLRTLQGTAGTSAVVVLRDAPPHDPEPWSGLSSTSVTRILLGLDAVPGSPGSAALAATARALPAGNREQSPTAGLDGANARQVPPPVALAIPAASEVPTFASTILYDVNAVGASSDVVGSVVDATGGRNFGIGTPEDVTTSILEAVTDAGAAPSAVLGVPPTVIAGRETTVSGLESTGTSPLSYGFDFEDDGVVDATNEDGFVSHTFATPGTYTVGLTVRDPRGRTSVTTIAVQVFDAGINPQVPIEGEPPQPPAPVFGSSGSSDGFNFGF